MTGLVAAISALGGAFGLGAGAAAGGFFSTVAGRLLASVALSALSQALIPKPRAPGIRTTVTQTGGTNPAAFILGTYATGGSAVCPPLSHGKVGKTPNAYLTYVIAVSDIPRVSLSGLVVDGETVEILTDTDPDYGNKIGGDYLDRMWIRFKNGQQTAADPMLVDKCGADPDFPWSADMIGEGIAYAIVTFRYDREVFTAFPDVRFVIDGIPLYDPRQDSTVGGSGAQRWNNRNTWEFSQNPVVMIYNILRGIRIGKLSSDLFWGGNAAADDLPLSNWIAAMNVCDQQIPLAAGGTQTRFRAAFEVSVDDEPAAVIEELLKACNGQIVDLGGEWKIRVGGPGLPVMFITDEDVLITRPEDFDPFPGVEATYNAITTTYPEPASQWEAKEAPPRTNATWEAEDGGRRLMARLDLPAVPYGLQAQRLARAFIRDHRRMRRHNLPLGPAAAKLEPLDVIGWTSEANGYVSKSFELPGTQADLTTCSNTLAAREVDPTDYDWSSGEELPSVPVTGVIRRPAPQVAVGFTVEGVYSDDGSERPRKPAIRLAWDAEALDDAVAIEWQMRRVGRTNVGWEGSMRNVAAGERVLSGGIVPGVTYEARIRPAFANRKRAWTAWQSATAPDIRLTNRDFVNGNIVSAIGDLGNLIPNNTIDDLDMWTASGAGVTVYADAAALGTKPNSSFGWINIAGDAADRFANSATFSVEGGVQYWLSGQIWRRVGSGTPTFARWQVLWFDHSGAFISAAAATATAFSAGAFVTAAVTAPANAASALVQCRLSGAAGSEFVFTSPSLRRRVQTANIVPSAVTQWHQVEAAGGSITAAPNVWQTMASLTITPSPDTDDLVFWLSATAGVTGGTSGTNRLDYRLLWRGTAVIDVEGAATAGTNQGIKFRLADFDRTFAGGTSSGTLTLQARDTSNATGATAAISDISMVIGEFKR